MCILVEGQSMCHLQKNWRGVFSTGSGRITKLWRAVWSSFFFFFSWQKWVGDTWPPPTQSFMVQKGIGCHKSTPRSGGCIACVRRGEVWWESKNRRGSYPALAQWPISACTEPPDQSVARVPGKQTRNPSLWCYGVQRCCSQMGAGELFEIPLMGDSQFAENVRLCEGM